LTFDPHRGTPDGEFHDAGALGLRLELHLGARLMDHVVEICRYASESSPVTCRSRERNRRDGCGGIYDEAIVVIDAVANCAAACHVRTAAHRHHDEKDGSYFENFGDHVTGSDNDRVFSGGAQAPSAATRC
jgi:hypothetical protein